jgi:hypothetical protein
VGMKGCEEGARQRARANTCVALRLSRERIAGVETTA